MLDIEFPMIMAPMFLVSNVAMIKAAMDQGIMGVFPSLNFREEGELEQVIDTLWEHRKKTGKGSFGVNLIVQRSNPLYKKHLKICLEKEVPFYITSLGNPKEVIDGAHAYGGKVFCDVTNHKHAKMVDGTAAMGSSR